MAKTIDQIITEVRKVLQEEGSELATFPDYGNLYIIVRAIASVISEQDSQLDTIYESLFINTSNNSNLDQRALEYGIERNPGRKSFGNVIIESDANTARSGGLIIRKGTILLNPYTNKQYLVLENTTVTNTRTPVPVESLEESSNSNVESGTKLTSSFFKNSNFVVGDSFNTITNQYEGDITGGTEKESDESLRSRILEIVRIKQSSTREALEATALNVIGVNSVLIEENQPSVGYITLYIDNTSFDVINETKRRTELVKPLGVILSVKPFENVAVNIDLNISLFNTENLENRNAEIRSIITNFVSSLNQSFSRESLAGVLLNNNYINNVEVIGPSSSLNITAKQKFTTGAVNIQYIKS